MQGANRTLYDPNLLKPMLPPQWAESATLRESGILQLKESPVAEFSRTPNLNQIKCLA